ncbi:MAG: hypothetical protein ABSA23_16540 [Anaerolineales bacterium]|jgi:hypothetical protein
MRRFSARPLSLGGLSGFILPARAQSAIELSGVGVTYTFGAQATFPAKIETQTTFQAAYLLFQGLILLIPA